MSLKYKSILITGGAGFIGSNIATLLKNRFPSLKIVVLDNLSRKGTEYNVRRLKDFNVEFIHGDIRNPEDLNLLTDFDLLIECSAEPSVLSGFGESPKYLINVNLQGAINCFELARIKSADIIFLSTSRVYPYDVINNLSIEESTNSFNWKPNQKIVGLSDYGINENFSLKGLRSMYGATKLSAEYILLEYLNMYGLKGVINRFGVVAGPWQFGKIDQGIASLWMLCHYFKKPLKYIGFGGKGKQVRDIINIGDLFDIILKQLMDINKCNGKIYNIGGGLENSISLIEATQICRDITGNTLKIGTEKNTRPADIPIYITDNSRISSDFKWLPKRTLNNTFEDIYEWIRNNEKVAKSLI